MLQRDERRKAPERGLSCRWLVTPLENQVHLPATQGLREEVNGKGGGNPSKPQSQDKHKSTASYHQVEWYLGRSLGRYFLPQAPPNVAHGRACNLELPGQLYLPVAVDGPLAGVLESWGKDATPGHQEGQSVFTGNLGVLSGGHRPHCSWGTGSGRRRAS